MKQTNRRQFLKGAALAGAAISFPSIVPAKVIPGKGKVMPNDRVNVGLIGCGKIATNYHLPLYKDMADVRMVAVCDAFADRASTMAKNFNEHYGSEVTQIHDDFRELLAAKDVDAVVIAAHDNWHTPMSIAAAQAGKDVFCQKPLALDYSQTPLLREVVKKNNTIFQFGTQFRSNGRFRLMIELVRNGYIGKLERMDTWCRTLHYDAERYHVAPYGSTEPVPVPEGFDFDAWQGPSPMAPYTVDRCTRWGGFHCPETALGFIAGCGIHQLGLAQWANKADHTSPIRYEATGKIPDEGIFRTLEEWDIHCEYENGVKMRFMDDRTAESEVENHKFGDAIVFHGSEGWIGWINWGFYASDKRIWKTKLKSDEEHLPVAKEHNRNFIDCVKSREEPMCPVEMAINCDSICHLGRAAALTGKVVEWDPASQQVIGNPEAAAMLGPQPVREKWKVW